MYRARRVLSILIPFLVSTLGASQGLACTMPLRALVDVDMDEAVFIGTVKEVVSRGSGASGGKPAAGVRVSVRDVISLPGGNGGMKEYVVYPFGLGTDCSRVPWTKGEMAKEFPPGAEVWVVGGRSAYRGPNELEAWSGDSRGLMLNRKPYATSAGTLYDYKGATRFALWPIEMRKDLVRLRKARTDGEKVKILRRLASCPGYGLQVYSVLVEHHLTDEKLVSELMKLYGRVSRSAASQGDHSSGLQGRSLGARGPLE